LAVSTQGIRESIFGLEGTLVIWDFPSRSAARFAAAGVWRWPKSYMAS